jgi:response regulator of citrate/malate metabolism
MRTRMDHAWANLWPDLLEGSNLITIDTWPGEEAVHRESAQVTNYRDNHPSTYRRRQSTQSRHVDVKAPTRWTAVRRSTTPSGIKRTSLQASQDSRGNKNSRVCISELAAKKSLSSSITWIYITLVDSSVQIKNKWEHAVVSRSTPCINSLA